jgi:hypothetical protein
MEMFVQSHHPPVRAEKERVKIETHPEGVDAGARGDPEPLSGRQTIRSKKPSQPCEEGNGFQDAVSDDDLPGDISGPQQKAGTRFRDYFLFFLLNRRDLTKM